MPWCIMLTPFLQRLDLDSGVSVGDPEGEIAVRQRRVHDKERDGGTLPGHADGEPQGRGHARAGAGEGEAEGQRLPAGSGVPQSAAHPGTEAAGEGKASRGSSLLSASLV